MSFTQTIPTTAQIPGTSNWLTSGMLASYDMKMPQNSRKLVMAFGSQNISGSNGLMESLSGGKYAVSGTSFRHWEEQRLGTIINATNGGAGASGVAVQCTVVAPYLVTGFPTVYDPYLAASAGYQAPNASGTATLMPVRLYQTIRFFDGTIGTVISIDSATQFTVAPDKIGAGTGNVIPALSGTETLVLGSINNGEGGNQPKPMNFTLSMVTGVMQIVNETASATGTALGEEVWIDNFDNGAGMVGSVYFYKNQWDSLRNISNRREEDMFAGQEVSNTGALATFDATLLKTQGLTKWSSTYSGVTNYNITSGVSLADFESLIIDKIDKNKGADENSIWSSIRLRRSIDAFIRPEMQAGAISYGAFGGGKDQYVNFGFSGFEHLGKDFKLKTYGLLNDPTSLGALEAYQNMGIVIPLSSGTSLFGDKKEKIETPALRMNYVKQGSYSRDLEEFMISGAGAPYNTTYDMRSINYRSHFGLEVFRINAYNMLQGS